MLLVILKIYYNRLISCSLIICQYPPKNRIITKTLFLPKQRAIIKEISNFRFIFLVVYQFPNWEKIGPTKLIQIQWKDNMCHSVPASNQHFGPNSQIRGKNRILFSWLIVTIENPNAFLAVL